MEEEGEFEKANRYMWYFLIVAMIIILIAVVISISILGCEKMATTCAFFGV